MAWRTSEARPSPAAAAVRLFLAVTVIGPVIAFSGWLLFHSWQATRDAATQRESVVLIAIQDELSRSLQALDLSLLAAIHGLNMPGLAAMDQQSQQAVLFGGAGQVDASQRLILTDAAGNIRYRFHSPVLLTNVSDRADFIVQRDHADLGLFFTPPERSWMDHDWILSFSRRITNPDGSFAGVALSRIGLNYFVKLFQALKPGPDGLITLISTDGPLVARVPFHDQDVGLDASDSNLLQAMAQAPSGVLESVSHMDGVRRLYSYGKLPALPFLVAVGIPMADVYWEWLEKSAPLWALQAVLVVISFYLLRRLWQEYRRRGVAEAEARYSEQRMQLLLENAEDHAIYLLDPEGRVESWNPGAEKIKGYRRDEIIGRSYAQFFTAEDQRLGEPQRLLAFASEHGHFRGEAIRVRKDGSQFLARVALTAIYDAAGALRGFAKVAHDLSRRKIEEEQRAIMIESTATGMLIVDEDGIITLSNSSADSIFGYPAGTLLGQPIDLLVPEGVRASHAALRTAFSHGTREGMAPDRQVSGRRCDGSEVMVEVTLRRVRTERGSIVVVSVLDSTQRLRRAAELAAVGERERAVVAEANARLEKLSRHLTKSCERERRANEAKSRFLTGVTHELRTPLNGILGYAQLLSLDGDLSPTQSARVQAMQTAGEHLLAMINAVLDLSEIEAGRVEMHPTTIDMPQLARACVDVVRPAAQSKGLALSLCIDPAVPPTIVADPTRLRQVVLNLLGNAVKFTAAGKVTLRVAPGAAPATFRMEIADTGPGVAPHHQQRLFQEFDRLDVASLGTIEGSGLGLAITARLVHHMAGQIGYADNSGGGSVFWLELPQSAQTQVRRTQTAAPLATARQAKLKVLVVDDVAMNRDIAAAFLRLAGHEVTCVDNGLAAVEAVAAGKFDVVLMDVQMPGMDGLEATREIRALPGPCAGVPIIAITAQAFSEQVTKCKAAGMTGHVAKPFQHTTLLAAVTEAVTAKRAPEQKQQPPSESTSIDLPVVDQDVYRSVADLFKPADLQRHLASLTDRGEALLEDLRVAGSPAERSALAEAAHALGGAAGVLGLRRLGAAALAFERGVGTGCHDADALTAGLIDEIERSIAAMGRLTELAMAET